MTKIRIYNSRKFFRFKFIMSCVFFLIGIPSLGDYVGLVFIFMGLVIITFNFGIEIDQGKKMIRNYTAILGIRIGKWENFNIYKALTIIKLKKGIRQYGCSNMSIDITDLYYDVALTTTCFRKRMQLFSSKDQNASAQFAEEWSKTLNLPLIDYKPVPSEKTMNRRMEREY